MGITEENTRSSGRTSRLWPAILASAAVLVTAHAARSDVLSDAIDALYNLRDTHQANVMKSVKGVAEAMNEGGAPAQPPPGESAIDYQLRMYDRLDRFYRLNGNLSRAQQELMNTNLKILQKLPAGDPGRAAIEKDIRNLVTQQKGSRESRDGYLKRRQAFHDVIQDHKKKTGSYPPHNCASAPGWHLPAGASCDGTAPPADAPASSTPHSGSGGHGP